MACIHGFAAGQCLICSTLRSGGDSGTGKQTAARSPAATLPDTAGGSANPRAAATAPVLTPAPPRVSRGRADRPPTPGRAPRRHGRTFTEVLLFLALIAVAVIAVGLSTNIIRGLVHILEVALVAVVAGVVGYGTGRLHGVIRRRERQRDER